MPAAPAPARQPRPFQPQPWRDRRIEIILGNLLRTGALISAAVVLLGACIAGVIQSALNGRGRGRGQGLIQLGLLLLIATPIARVAFSVVGFAIERDRLYVAFTLIVLAILLYSLLGSGLGV